MTNTFQTIAGRVVDFFENAAAFDGQTRFDTLALELFALQFTEVPPYRRFCEQLGRTPDTVQHWHQIPAVPAAAFKEFALTGLDPADRTHTFHSSGTTAHQPSHHYHHAASLALYEASLWPWFRRHLLPDDRPLQLMALTPPLEAAPHSSLVHMLDTVRRRAAFVQATFLGQTGRDGSWHFDAAAVVAQLYRVIECRVPLLLAATAYGFVQLLEHLAAGRTSLPLPDGSRVMETGGYKGRSRTLTRAQLYGLITRHLEVPPSHIVAEYGMSELSAQAYDHVAGHPESSRRGTYGFPPWARARVLSPENGEEVSEGRCGLLCVFDLANVWSVMAIQTEDLGIRRGHGFELAGRAAAAEPRGCSLLHA